MELVYPFQVQFAFRQNAASSLLYGSVDAWNELTASERSGHTRSDINTAYVYAYEDGALIEYMAESIVRGAADVQSNAEVDDIGLVTYGENEVIEISFSQEVFGVSVPLTAVLYVEDGYMHTFLFAGNGDQATQDFHSVLSSLQTPSSGGTGSGQSDEMVEPYKRLLTNSCLFLLELGVTFLIYALPFVVYRNVIRKRPVSKKVFLIIIIVLYEFVAWVFLNTAMAWFLRHYANFFCAIFWGWFSYRKMVRRKDTDGLPEDAGGSAAPQQPVRPAAPVPQAPSSPEAHAPVSPKQQTPPATPRIQFCRKCGFRLLDDSRFCSVCGTPVVSIPKE